MDALGTSTPRQGLPEDSGGSRVEEDFQEEGARSEGGEGPLGKVEVKEIIS